MDLLVEAEQGNRTFRITFPTGERVPFRLLRWGDFNAYQELFVKQIIPKDVLEDTIFRKCCLDPVCIDSMHEMYAGVVTTVVDMIMHLSGPNDVDTFNQDIEIARKMINTINSQVVMVICRAFPAYKPEDILGMPWADILLRLAQAECILMSRNPPELTEPIRMLTKQEQDAAQQKQQGQVNVNELIKDGRKDAAEMGKLDPKGLSEIDLEIGRKAAAAQQRRAIARRLGT